MMRITQKLIPVLIVFLILGCQRESSGEFNPAAEKRPGYWIVYSAIENENYAIYLMDENGQNRRLLKDSLTLSPNPLWSPDGRQILYYSESNLYLINPDGSNNRPLTRDAQVEYVTFCWSPDGRQIVFSGAQKLYRINIDGSGLTVLTSLKGNIYNTVWSPDGLKILFVLAKNNGTFIYSVDANGQNPVALTRSGKDERPCWSPDSKKILFTSRRDGPTQIYSMRFDGSSQKRLTFTETTEIYQMWSPNSTKVAFVSFRDATIGGKIFLMNSDGGHQKPLTLSPGVDYPKDWSRDNTKILYISRLRGNSDLFYVDVATGQEKRLTNTAALEENAQFSPMAF